MHKLKTLSDRLKFAMQKMNTSQADLSRTIGIKPAALQYLLSSDAQSSRFTFELAHALNVRTEWLSAGVGVMTDQQDPLYQLARTYNRIPLMSIDETRIFQSEAQRDLESSPTQWIFASKTLGDYCFAVQLTDTSMKPIFPKGAIIILDQEKRALNNSYVLIKLIKQNEIIFRKLSLSAQPKIIPLNSDMYNSIDLDNKDKILGCAVEVRIGL